MVLFGNDLGVEKFRRLSCGHRRLRSLGGLDACPVDIADLGVEKFGCTPSHLSDS